MSGKVQAKASLEAKTAGRVVSSGVSGSVKTLARAIATVAKGIVATFGLKTTVAGTTAIVAGSAALFVPGAKEAMQGAANALPSLSFLSELATKVFGTIGLKPEGGTQTEPKPTGLMEYMPTAFVNFLRENLTQNVEKGLQYGVVGLGALVGFKAVARGLGIYTKTEVYHETKLEVKKDGKHAKRVSAKLKEIQDSKASGGAGLSSDQEFMKGAIYLDLSFFRELDPQLASSDQFLKDLAEGANGAALSKSRKQALVKKILETQTVLTSAVPVQTKREFLEALGSVCPDLLPTIVQKYGASIHGDQEALASLLKLSLPQEGARKDEIVDSRKLQVATTKAILKSANKAVLDRPFLLELGAISESAMKEVLFPLLDGEEPMPKDHLNFMLAQASKDPHGAYKEAEYLQNTPAFMAAVCAADPTMVASLSDRLLKTPAFLADLFDRNPQAVKEVLKTPLFKMLLAKNNRKIHESILKVILRFSHDARFVDSIVGQLPKLSESTLAMLVARTPSLLKTKLLINKGLPLKQEFVKAVLRKNPWVLKELPRSVKTKKLLEELVSEIRPFSNIRRRLQGKMLKHNQLIAAITHDPDCASFVQPGGILTTKDDLNISRRAKKVIVSHAGSFESREKTYLDILQACPDFINQIPVPNSEEDWEKFVIKACKVNPEVIDYLPAQLSSKLESTSSDFVKALFAARKEKADEVLERLKAQAQGNNAETASLYSDTQFIAELAKSDRRALKTLLSEDDRSNALLMRELDRKHHLGKGVYTYADKSVDKRSFWIPRSLFTSAADKANSFALRMGNSYHPLEKIKGFLFGRNEEYSPINRRKFDPVVV